MHHHPPRPPHGDSHPGLPLDPDSPASLAEAPGRRERTGLVLAVAAGGLAGAAVRDLVARALPVAADRVPWATLVVNVTGSFILGALLEVLVERSPLDPARARLLRHLLGVGFCGALTTYSTFALESDLSLRGGNTVLALGGGAAAVLLGVLAAALGIAAGRHLPPPRRPDRDAAA